MPVGFVNEQNGWVRMVLEVAMRSCPNAGCVAFGRIVYSVATRCPLCRWDLKNTLPQSETTALKPAQQPNQR
jgi:hypothetical protein